MFLVFGLVKRVVFLGAMLMIGLGSMNAYAESKTGEQRSVACQAKSGRSHAVKQVSSSQQTSKSGSHSQSAH